jgi:hypothetical protein
MPAVKSSNSLLRKRDSFLVWGIQGELNSLIGITDGITDQFSFAAIVISGFGEKILF